jgi:transposase
LQEYVAQRSKRNIVNFRIDEVNELDTIFKMPPITRSQRPQTPPERRSRGIQADTIKKTRFFEAFDKRDNAESLRSVSKAVDIPESTARRWLHERNQLGSKAYRRTRNLSDRLGRKSRVSDETCKMLVSPSRNPVRDQLYEAQIEYFQLPIKRRQLQTRLKQSTYGGQRYKQAFIRKVLSEKNHQLRVEYGEEHKGKSIDNFWQFIYFTDEAHIDPSSMAQGYILRELGQRYNTENIQERGEKRGVKLHIAAWVNWHRKAEKLKFYNDEEEHIEQPRRPPKPRKTMYEADEAFQARLREWEAMLPHMQIVKPRGNAMTQKYYTEHILPLYINAIHKARTKDSGWPQP